MRHNREFIKLSFIKFKSIFAISLQQEIAYKANIVLGQLRNILQIFLIFFLWDAVFTSRNGEIFGYNKAKILTYIFGILIIRSVVLSSKSVEAAGEISRGAFSSYLLKPFSFFKYWIIRDLSNKTLNIFFAIIEFLLLFYILKPPFFLQTHLITLLSFLLALLIALIIYFCLIFIASAVPFWSPDASWGAQFLLTAIFVEFLSGAVFPIDVLPSTFQFLLNLTPFPYLLYFPLQVYLGNIVGFDLVRGFLISGFWVLVLWTIMKYVWGKGST